MRSFFHPQSKYISCYDLCGNLAFSTSSQDHARRFAQAGTVNQRAWYEIGPQVARAPPGLALVEMSSTEEGEALSHSLTARSHRVVKKVMKLKPRSSSGGGGRVWRRRLAIAAVVAAGGNRARWRWITAGGGGGIASPRGSPRD